MDIMKAPTVVLTLLEHPNRFIVFNGVVCVAHSLVFRVLFWKLGPVSVSLAFFFWYCCCQFFFDLYRFCLRLGYFSPVWFTRTHARAHTHLLTCLKWHQTIIEYNITLQNALYKRPHKRWEKNNLSKQKNRKYVYKAYLCDVLWLLLKRVWKVFLMLCSLIYFVRNQID